MDSRISDQIQMLPRTYKEDQAYRTDDSEPCSRSENIVFKADSSKWHVRVTFRGQIGITKRSGLLKRRKNLEAFISMVDFHLLPLIPDTVSELVIEQASYSAKLPLNPGHNPESSDSLDADWTYIIQEDVARVRYPNYENNSNLPAMILTDIEETEQLSNNVFLITKKDEATNFIYKTVDHPFNEPNHTTMFERELHNLQLYQDSPSMVQLIAVVKAPSPYQTTTTPSEQDHNVIYGMVLEYHPNGTLEDAITRRDGKGVAWKSWPRQLARALLRLHDSCITHMDVAPRNAVIDASNGAVWIDIGVGYTYENLAPELRDDSSPLDASFEVRCRSDWWAFGKLLVELASIEDGGFSDILRDIGGGLCLGNFEERLGICDAIQQL
ncbi:kinase-like protein [Aspergillus steynii IBT 23096]|uniref:Kinase-like protein n=1 Tax=Aspergillus steynii IBT 23096 TaxID=1392250 RepID=A0A2I2FRW2_9EURO|nr:kinase-like protein [Aspergillus steynii IBT 23096]PLB43346.1 kinase-like protein [Aspergillus steynii IBT 23096]